MRRAVGLAFVGLIVSASIGEQPALADVDVTGRWSVSNAGGPPPFCIDFAQAGSSLIGNECSGIASPYTGTIDPMTGAFFVTQPAGSSCTPVFCCPDNYCDLSATAAADSQTFSGTLTCYLIRFTGCASISFAVAGARLVCGDGVVGAGEECDDGNTTAGDCCSPTCQFEPSSVVCRASAGTCDAAESCTGASGTCPADASAPDGTPCDDGDACTAGETCSAGACDGGTSTCPAAFKCYAAEDLQDPKFVAQPVATVDQLTDETLEVKKPRLVCNPVALAGSPVPDPETRLTCYQVMGDRLPPAKVEVSNQLGTLRLGLKKPKLLCVPSTAAP